MGFPITGPTSVLCDNQSVVTNASRPESTLSKKHTAIAYHRCRGLLPQVHCDSDSSEAWTT
jgi:hypothetical protein